MATFGLASLQDVFRTFFFFPGNKVSAELGGLDRLNEVCGVIEIGVYFCGSDEITACLFDFNTVVGVV